MNVLPRKVTILNCVLLELCKIIDLTQGKQVIVLREMWHCCQFPTYKCSSVEFDGKWILLQRKWSLGKFCFPSINEHLWLIVDSFYIMEWWKSCDLIKKSITHFIYLYIFLYTYNRKECFILSKITRLEIEMVHKWWEDD